MGYFLKLFTGNPLAMLWVALAIAAVAGGAGASAGWTLNGWRLSGDVNRLQGEVDTQKQSLATMEGANKRCAAGVSDVREAVAAIAKDAAARSAEAAAAAARAQKAAEGHMAAAAEALNRKPPAPGKECDTAAEEAAAYAKKRKAKEAL